MQFLLTLLLLAISTATYSQPSNGMVSIKSAFSVDETANRLESALHKKSMTIFKRVDHQQGAKDANLELRPSTLVIFGNPKVGTPLMQCRQSVAIDLPQKALIWEDKDGTVWFSYNDPEYLKERHKIEGCDDVISKIKTALANFAKVATG